MKRPHFNIPVFIPELACPFRCVYCNQYNISGRCAPPDPRQVLNIIENHLLTLPTEGRTVEVAFFGGSFTGLAMEQQNIYLDLVQNYIDSGLVQGIRLSTRPDYISASILHNLKKKRVRAIELGAQSLDEEVLAMAGRGHKVEDVVQATKIIREAGIETGLQMMTGLPGDTTEKSLATAHRIITLGADTVRIYPTLVIEDTDLANLYRQGKYHPQTLEEATGLCAELFLLFNEAGVNVLRMGLHSSETFNDGGSLLAGPFHPAFGELVMTKVWKHRIEKALSGKGNTVELQVHPSQLNAAVGHKAANKKWLAEKFRQVVFRSHTDMEKYDFSINIY